ncbi:putative glycosyltransferase EpsF [compost metagenome]
MISEFGVSGKKLKVVPYGMDINAFQKLAEQPTSLDARPGQKILICPARLVHIKGHKYLLDALAMLKNVRTDWKCYLLGNGPAKDELLEQRKGLHLEEHVEFLGDRHDVPSLLRIADIFVLPSIQDNLPFSIMEAQSLGKPIVVSDAGGIPEMVSHGKNGLVSPAGQSEPIFFNLLHLLQNDGLRAQMGEQAKRWANQQWSIQKMMDRTLAAYANVLSQRFVQ